MRYLLDTDFVIGHLTGQQDARNTLAQLLPNGVAVSIITFSEIYEGVYGSRDSRAATRAFTTFLRGVAVLAISRSVAKRNARLRLGLRRQGRPITHRALDLLITATALEHDLVLFGGLCDGRDCQSLAIARLQGGTFEAEGTA